MKFVLITYSLFCLITLTACIRNGVHIEKNEPLLSDDDYMRSYREVTRTVKIYNDFETKYTMTITNLDKNFQKALATRIKSLMMDDVPALSEAGNKTAFFVSAFGPDDRLMDIDDPQLWNFILKQGDKELKPSNIQKLGRKERWLAYFPAINKWTSEYLIIFDAPPLGGADLVKPEQIELKFANSDAKVAIVWP